MKPKKFSQIYREAAEKLASTKRAMSIIDAIYASRDFSNEIYHRTTVQFWFLELFFNNENGYDFCDANGKHDLNHRITALLLASEIAKSEGK